MSIFQSGFPRIGIVEEFHVVPRERGFQARVPALGIQFGNMTDKIRRALLAALPASALGMMLAASPVRAADVPNIAAAADLKFALTAVAEAFAGTNGRRVNLSFGSSGIFRRQIAEGAPFELFFSADEGYVAALAREGRTEDAGTLYAIGRIVLYLPNGSPVKADREMKDLLAATRDGRLRKLAMASPEHAPYGRAAREALQRAGAWEAVRDHLVLGENAAQAARFAISGSAQAAILPYSLAIAPELSGHGAFVTVPETWHAPLRQRMALVKGAGETARRFHAFVQEAEARAILARHGFVVPQPAK
jgi:molybdate transport system substrate-binding protein